MLNFFHFQVTVIGSGNWGSVIGKIVATNARNSYIFNDDKVMQKLNLQYTICQRACQTLAASGGFHPNAKAISLIKGLYVDDLHKPKLSSEIIKETLGLECCVLSGANVAKDVADEQFCEATIGYTDMESAIIWQQLLDTPYFKINGVPDVAGVEVCGAVKNVIALAAGFCDGLSFGTNTKAAIIRQGFEELRRFATYFYNGLVEETFFDSAGIADTITTCFGGRNVKCAAEFVKCQGSKTWPMIENEMLNGQKLQGTLTCEDIYKILKQHDLNKMFPLFSATYRVAFEGFPASEIVNIFKVVGSLRPIRPMSACNPCLVPTLLKEVDQE
ncbi:putative glycerol-3-phosphate dehydrogenase (gpdh), partial [Cardiosporidium cionae]